ncbi:PTS sugar transporter subunit IIB [Clostridium mediterraneense]|uniref:PTS sugar transporter subunit IIB n=1 Tax=Clostridium mediterraneense TaxID=1805472 RepID=UPI0008356EFB|nr:PTS sugar transporter subunit IIB [Clostridium mediterraneense]
MKKILLVCSAGMSTSLLVTKMQEAAANKGIECSIEAVAEADAQNKIDDIDVLLLGPQVRFLLSKFKGLTEGKNVPVEVIDTVAYGTMNGEKVLTRALELIG